MQSRKIIIQPSINSFEAYSVFAQSTNIQFEIIDFSLPNNSEEDIFNTISFYKEQVKTKPILSKHGMFLDIYINSPDHGIRKLSKKRIIDNLDITDELDLKYAVFHTNALPMMGKEAYYKNWERTHIEFWEKTIPKYRATILLENMWERTPNQIKNVLSEVNSPQLKICFDTGHWNVHSDLEMEKWFESLGEHIEYIHLNDNMGVVDSELPPGKGNINWKLFSKLVQDYCDNPYLVLEVANLNLIEESLNFIIKNNVYPFIP
jgi:sugar phosphate isomerase/epimerase